MSICIKIFIFVDYNAQTIELFKLLKDKYFIGEKKGTHSFIWLTTLMNIVKIQLWNIYL